MRTAALSLLIMSSTALSAETNQAPAPDVKPDQPAAETQAEPAKTKAQSSVAQTMTLEAAMALKLNKAKALGLTVYKGKTFLRPGLTVLGLPSKLPEPMTPGRDETVPESMPPGPNDEKNQPSDSSVNAGSETK